MDRRRRSSLAASPLLIGAITTLIVVVAVFLAYNANNGLPFVPTYDINVQLPEASGLIPSNQVRIAGTRVGIITGLKAVQNPLTGRVSAIAELQLEKSVEPLPADTTAIVQSVSAIGLKYLELEKGTSRRTLRAGQTIPVSQTKEPVNIDELFNTFDSKTRTAIKVNTNNFGDGLAGRGLGLNNTIAELRPLVTNALPVLHDLSLPETDLRGLFIALERVAGQSAPVAQQQANYYTYLDIFFKEFARVAPSLEAATEGGPPALKQAIFSLAYERPFTEAATEFMRLLRPSAATLTTIAAPLGHAVTEGSKNLIPAVALNAALAKSAVALNEFGENPVVQLALDNFTETLEAGNPLLAGIAPAQSFCNYFTLAFRNVASLEAQNIGVGTVARAGFVLAPTGPNNEGYPSSAPANGPSVEHEFNSNIIIDNNHVHFNPYPNVGAPGQPKLCEAGNVTYVPFKAVIGNAPASSVSTNREITTREQNLFGETYPASTLKALGLTKGASK
ncbi:MAG TPA: MlaD family protein [Solirubrobacteraceae bacterium]|nr:MlaD family protein [Solirubrobacteraceae bacterium]